MENRMDNLDTDIDGILDIGIDLTLPDDIPAPTAEEMRLLAPLLPPDFGKQPTTKPKKLAPASLTRYSEKISMRIPRPVLALLKEEAKRRGIPYQTFLNMILGQLVTGSGWA